METIIQKWGNSLALRIPSKIAKKLNLHKGSAVNLKFQDDHLEVIPQKYNLAEMLLKITDKNLHNESFNEDEITGKEVW